MKGPQRLKVLNTLTTLISSCKIIDSSQNQQTSFHFYQSSSGSGVDKSGDGDNTLNSGK